ncbi:fluoride efflux transporter CrcB [Thalassobacillus pellis]|uniref:fluoride efflux transporter CrcB n=1 Tax=Thalassobacillus pellis TaxID=748008 RepID=UPI001961188B|nr:fluoride efflux transporter CrcB [Thalassobacillus pellis]MBM7551164.1 CrcB protein [Thalassobacillus pellis]
MVYFWVGLGGFIGAILRYSFGEFLYVPNQHFPFSTLAVNLMGAFVLALLTYGFVPRRKGAIQLQKALGTGLLGAFTTFSTLSVETMELFQQDEFFLGLLYLFSSVLGGFLFAGFGYRLAKTREVSP